MAHIQPICTHHDTPSGIILRPGSLHIFHADPTVFHFAPKHAAGNLPLHQLYFVAGLQIFHCGIACACAGTDMQIIRDHHAKDRVFTFSRLHRSAAGTGALLTVGRCLPAIIFVSQGMDIGIPIAGGAPKAGMLGIALLCAGRFYHRHLILMQIRQLLQIRHGSIAADALVLHMGPVALAFTGGFGHCDLGTGGNGTDDTIARAMAVADQKIRIGSGADIGAGIGFLAIAVAATMRIGVIRYIPISGHIPQNVGLAAVFCTQPGSRQRDQCLTVAGNRIRTVENIILVTHQEHRMGQLAAIKHDALRMLVQQCLQTGNADTGCACMADGNAGTLHLMGEAPAQTHTVHPGSGPQGGFRHLTPVIVIIYVEHRPQHHGRRTQGTSAADQLRKIQRIRQLCTRCCGRLRKPGRQTYQNQKQAQPASYFFHRYSPFRLPLRHAGAGVLSQQMAVLYSKVYIIASFIPEFPTLSYK